MEINIDEIKTCHTCAHKSERSVYWATCIKSGYRCIGRRHVYDICDKDFSGWAKREFWIMRMFNWFI